MKNSRERYNRAKFGLSDTRTALSATALKSGKRSDYALIAVTVALCAFGCLMVYSAGMYSGKTQYGNEYYYLYKQLIGVFGGIAALIAFSYIDYHVLAKLRYVLLIASVALLLLVFIPGVGQENYGARRWIELPFFTIQASEPAKFGFIIFTAAYMSKNASNMTRFKFILPVVGVGALICVLIVLEPNMSVTLCMAALMIAMLFMGRARPLHIAMIALPLVVAAITLIVIEPYRFLRLLAFIDPWSSPLEEGYQLIQSYYALGAGGWFGVGLFNSRQKYLFLPFSESDFIFSVIGEEFGIFGCAILIAAYAFLIWRAVKVALNAADLFGAYLAGGIAAIIAIQVCVNIAVVTGSIPPTGLPLPFISSGSSSIIMFCAGVGIVNGVKRRSHYSVECFGAQKRTACNRGNRGIEKHGRVVGERVAKQRAKIGARRKENNAGKGVRKVPDGSVNNDADKETKVIS